MAEKGDWAAAIFFQPIFFLLYLFFLLWRGWLWVVGGGVVCACKLKVTKSPEKHPQFPPPLLQQTAHPPEPPDAPYLVVVIIVNLHLIAVPEELWDRSATDDAVEAHRVAFPHLKVSGNLLELGLGVGLEDAALVLRATPSSCRVPGEGHRSYQQSNHLSRVVSEEVLVGTRIQWGWWWNWQE